MRVGPDLHHLDSTCNHLSPRPLGNRNSTDRSYAQGVMMGTDSFRTEFRTRLGGYRTPSPPRLAVEPLSPPWTASAPQYASDPSHGKKRKHDSLVDPPLSPENIGHSFSGRALPPLDTRPPSQRTYAPSALDVFAAVATSPSLAQDFKSPPNLYSATGDFTPDLSSASHPTFERVSKRTKSEHVHRPVAFDKDRPMTSYVGNKGWDPAEAANFQSNGHNSSNPPATRSSQVDRSCSDSHSISHQDAELLLGFARAAHGHQKPMPYREDAVLQQTSMTQTGNIGLAPTTHTQRKTFENRMPTKQPGILSIDPSFHDFPASGATETPQADPNKPREHRGWPKGKPRGPRAPGAVRKKRSDAGARKQDSKPKEPRGGRKKAKERQDGNGEDTTTASGRVAHVTGLQRERRNSNPQTRLGLLSYSQEALQYPLRSSSLPPRLTPAIDSNKVTSSKQRDRSRKAGSTAPQVEYCPACQLRRNKINGFQDLWINCSGCKSWIHATCAGFDTEKKVKEVDKFYCQKCEVTHGTTTFVRKSSRAHASVDYAGLHEGKVRTAVDIPDHHYISPIKEGLIQFQPEMFPRMPPELVTADYFAKCGQWTEPILIPAALNPRPEKPIDELESQPHADDTNKTIEATSPAFRQEYEYDLVADDGQDKLDMVIPRGLTVRRAAELYGPEERVDVIDVKLQEGEDRRWTMRQWADYYEAEGEKPVRNVISLEVSQSLLGRLIRRPKVVRDLDLQDSVWPEEDAAKGIVPRVQFYCLMSVADCFTDFHIDFGGSSVYYHILKGRKTFFFIPPKPKHLKKYEDWCNSPDQNSVWLGDQTKECYRVDLYPGDTMLIPSGWIHAVWTPENSLVIGGNFLTRLNFGMQIQVNDIEKATNVTRKFRYPFFQKILWQTAVQYLQHDPIPSTVAEILLAGGKFERNDPIWYELEDQDHGSPGSPECFNSRYYPKGEIQGLPDLIRYLFRTVMISLGKVPGVSKSTQDAVIRSMPKNHGSHLDIIRTFAMWAAWKRGNEEIPAWAYPDATLSEMDVGVGDKKLSAAAQRRLDRQAQHEAHKSASDRRMLRTWKDEAVHEAQSTDGHIVEDDNQRKSPTDIRRLACDDCRRKRRRCSHNVPASELQAASGSIGPQIGIKHISRSPTPSLHLKNAQNSDHVEIKPEPRAGSRDFGAASTFPLQHGFRQNDTIHPSDDLGMTQGAIMQPYDKADPHTPSQGFARTASYGGTELPMTAACFDCRQNKRRCEHVDNNSIDSSHPFELSITLQHLGSKRRRSEDDTLVKGVKKKRGKVDAAARLGQEAPSTSGLRGKHLRDVNSTVVISEQRNEDPLHVAAAPAGPPLRPQQASTMDSIMTDSVIGGQTPNRTGNRLLALPALNMDLGQGAATGMESRSRTPSSNQQTTVSENATTADSPVTSPLTDLESSPKTKSIDVVSHDPRYPATNGFSQSTGFRKPSSTRDASPRRSGNQSQATPSSFARPNETSKKRSESRSASRELAGGTSRMSMSPTKKSPSETRTLTPAEVEEAENLKAARMFAMEDYSLRRRRL